MDCNNTDVVVILDLHNEGGTTFRASEASSLKVRVWTSDRNLFLSYRQRDIEADDDFDRLTIPARDVRCLPTGVLVYEYTATVGAEEVCETVVTDIYWRNISYHNMPANPINYLTINELKDSLEGKADADNTYTKAEVDKLLTDAATGEVDLSGYATTEAMNVALADKAALNHSHEGYLTEHQSLDAYATIEALDEALEGKADADHTHEGYATEEWVNAKNYLTEHQSLNGYYTKSEVDNKITDTIAGEIDLSGYVTTTAMNTTLADYATTASLADYATEEWVESKKYLTTHQSLSDYVTTAAMNTALDNYVVLSAMDGLASTEWVESQNYVTTTAMNTALNNYATTAALADYATTAALADYATTAALANYATTAALADYATTADMEVALDEKVDVEGGKGLSSNDYTDADQAKLAAIPSFWFGTQAEYDAIDEKDNNTVYYIYEGE